MTSLVYPVRVKMTTSTTGTGTFVYFGSAVSGYQSFSDALSTDAYVKYTIEDANGGWEVGTGLVDVSSGALDREPHASSNSGSRIDLSGDAVIYATTSHHEVASRQLLANGTVSNQTYLSYDWKRGTTGGATDDAGEVFSKYELLLDRFTPVSDARIYLRIRYPSGPYSYTSTSNLYDGQYLEAISSTDYAATTTTSVHYLSRYDNVGGSAEESGWSGSITFMTDMDEYGVTQDQQIHSIGGYIDDGGNPLTHQAFTRYTGTVDIQGFYLFCSVGNLDTGKWSLYGVRD